MNCSGGFDGVGGDESCGVGDESCGVGDESCGVGDERLFHTKALVIIIYKKKLNRM
jgi:hypothetical protein